MQLALRDHIVDPSDWPVVMGVLNVTPDSFSDGGRFESSGDAVTAAMGMIADGAAIVDVGPESTRPGSSSVSDDEQISRAIPVIERIRSQDAAITISIDTTSAKVARAAIDAGADMINDTSALRDDPAMADVASCSQALLCLMHRRGRPADMQRGGGPEYADVIAEILSFLKERIELAAQAGIARGRIVVDPGIGFGKRTEDNLVIMKNINRFVESGHPVLIGASRKRFIGEVLGADDPCDRKAGSLTCAVLAAQAGAAIVRVHDVRATVEAIRLHKAIVDG
ncbi:MAG: dihydropteroate synthase [Planctomycetes bacterium]|nr:dihydropteroate synthase [Planctomycetota bacterium]